MSLCSLPIPIRQKLRLSTFENDGRLIIDSDVLQHVAGYIIYDCASSDRWKLDNIVRRFMSEEVALFRVDQDDESRVYIDAAIVLMGNLGVEVDNDDWQQFKRTIRNDISRVMRTNSFSEGWSAASSSQVHMFANSFSQQDLDGGGGDDEDEDEYDLRAENRRLNSMLESKTTYIQSLLHERRMLKQQVRRLEDRIVRQHESFSSKLADAKQQLNSEFHAHRTGNKPKSWLTPSGSVAVALRRNLGNIACALLGHVILQDIAGCTVSRCEVKAGASLMANAQVFFQVMKAELRASNPNSLVILAFREDATNSGIWRKSKLAAMELECFWTQDLTSMTKAESLGHHLKRLADVQRVSDSTAVGSVAMTLKQMQSLGAPCWYNLAQDFPDAQVSPWFVFAQTTDRGPNEVLSRAIHSNLYDQVSNKTLFFELDCNEHCVHLCVMSGLSEIDNKLEVLGSPFKYFASCAVLANVLRDVCRGVFNTWMSMYGIESALAKVKTLFPKAIGGRWGSIHAFEARCLKCGPELHSVLKAVLESKPVKKQNQKNDDGNLILDTLSLEATRDYSVKMGRWRKRALDVTGSYLYWCCMLVMHTAREPLIHFSNFLKQKHADKIKITELANGKTKSILNDLWQIFFWSWDNAWFDKISVFEFQWLKDLLFYLVCKYASQFSRRVDEKVNQYPFRLFRLIHKPPEKVCEYRKEVAQELCEGLICTNDDTEDDVNERDLKFDRATRKLMNNPMFREQIEHARKTGRLGYQLHTLLSLAAKFIKVDVRENERVNKLLSMLGESCPNASLDLVSSRASIKFALGDGSRTKWSRMRIHAKEIMDCCVSSWQEKDDILRNSERWADPILPDDARKSIQNVTKQLKDDAKLGSASVWAASMNLQWFKACDNLQQLLEGRKIHFDNIAFYIGDREPQTGDLVYFVIEKVHSNRRVQVCEYHEPDSIEEGQATISFGDWLFTSSLSILQDEYPVAVASRIPTRFIYPIVVERFVIDGLFAVGEVVTLDKAMLKDYMFPLHCSKKTVKRSKRLAVAQKRTQLVDESESESDIDIDDDDFDMNEVTEVGKAQRLFEQGLLDLAENAKQYIQEDQGHGQGDADISNMDELSSAEVDRTMKFCDIDITQDTIEESELDKSGAGDRDNERSSDSQRLVDKVEETTLKKAVKEGYLNLTNPSPTFLHTLEELENSGMQPEEAALEAAMNSERVIGNIEMERSTGAGVTISETIHEVRDTLTGLLTDTDVERIYRQADQLQGGEFVSNSLRAYACWATDINKAIFAFAHAHTAHKSICGDFSKLDSSRTGLSLVLYRDERSSVYDPEEYNLQVVLVQWVLGGKTGRIADLDDQQKVIAIVASGKKRIPIDFHESHIIHPVTGVFMEKVRKRERPSLPEHIKRLKDMWTCAVQANCMPEHKGLQLLKESETTSTAAKGDDCNNIIDSCGASQAAFVCICECLFCGNNLHNTGPTMGKDGPTQDSFAASASASASNVDFIQQCCVCLHYWHMSCSRKLVDLITLEDDSDFLPTSSSTQFTAKQYFTYSVATDSGRVSRSSKISHKLQVPDIPSDFSLPDQFQPSTSESDGRRATSCLSCAFSR